MKKIGFFSFSAILVLISSVLFAKPINLYEQLCEVNQEWYKNRAIAQELGFLEAKPIADEQDLLVFHIQTLEKIFLQKANLQLSETQRQNRQQTLKVLNEYWHLRDCPRNYYIPYRIPVFIDEQGRYCAVAYLMLKSGKKTFCETVQKTNNNIYIRQIDNQEFSEWQKNSGLSIDELAWIQPGYEPWVKIAKWRPNHLNETPIFLDSIASTRIYLPQYDYKDIFRFSRIFLGVQVSEEELTKISQSLTNRPNWQTIPSGRVVCANVMRNELYVSIDSLNFSGEGEEFKEERFSTVYKWNKSRQWEKVLDLSNTAKDSIESVRVVYSLFEYGGKIYAGGGYYKYDSGVNEHSYLAYYEGGKWHEIQQDFGGYIFGLIYKTKNVYLGVVFSGLNLLMDSPTIEPEAESETSIKNK